MPRKWSIEDIKNFLQEHDIYHECELLSTEYTDSRTPLLFKCNICGNTFERNQMNLKAKVKHGHFCCRNCGSKRGGQKQALTIEDVQKYIADNNITNATLISQNYVNNRTPLEFLCNKCGKSYSQTFDKFKASVYHTCSSCAHKVKGYQKKYTAEDVQNIISKDDFVLIGEYVDTHTPVLCKCKNGHIFNLYFTHYLLDGRGCMQCFRDYYRGENTIQWRGGVTSLTESLRRCIGKWKQQILLEANYQCDITKETENLEVHHLNINFLDITKQAFKNLGLEEREASSIKDFSLEELRLLKKEIQELHNSVEGIVLTKKIHTQFHKEYGYFNNTKEQYYEFKTKILNERQEE